MKKIIIVEDDPGIQETFRIIFKEPEYKITSYDNGAQLMNNNYEMPELFILDKQLSGADGLDICRHLKNQEHSKDIPVIMISANPNIVALAKAAGADDVLVKPYRLVDLRKVVGRYIQ